jgi:uncharacterized protein YkwD
MFAPAFLTIARLLLVGLASTQPIVPSAPKPVVQNAVVATASLKAANQPTTSAVRDYTSAAYSTRTRSITSGDAATGIVTLSAEESALFDQTNRDREEQGLSDLQIDPMLCLVARGHSADMAQRKYFDHLAPTPGPVSPMDRYLAALGSRPNYAFLGENIYYRSLTDDKDVTAAQANNAFMHSEGHRANILQPKFVKMGIGFYRDPVTGAFWVTEMFLNDQN